MANGPHARSAGCPNLSQCVAPEERYIKVSVPLYLCSLVSRNYAEIE